MSPDDDRDAVDVAVAGAGPAGLAAAAACADAGLRVRVVAPAPTAPWVPTYGVWEDELAAASPLAGPAPLRHRWPGVTVVGAVSHHLDRPYGLLDNDRLQARLLGLVARQGGTVLDGAVVAADLDGPAAAVRLADGTSFSARAVVDASGHEPVLVRRAAGPPPAFQHAWGIVARCDRPPAEPGTCVLMDWSGAPPGDRTPTFLYAMDLGDGRWFLEETSLAHRPGIDREVLRRRLERRLAGRGVVVDEVLDTEWVRIPMGVAVPDGAQPVAGFGGAASLVHPATGYSVGTSLRLATVLADAVVAGLARGDGPAAVAHQVWQALWPVERRRVRALEHYGLEALLRFDAEAAAAFFDAFFALAPERWQGYLAGTLDRRQTAGAMRAVFLAAPRRVQRLLATGNPRWLVRAVVGAG